MKLANNLTIESQMQAYRSKGFMPVQLDQILNKAHFKAHSSEASLLWSVGF